MRLQPTLNKTLRPLIFDNIKIKRQVNILHSRERNSANGFEQSNVNHQSNDTYMTGLFQNIIQLMSYSWSVTLVIFHFPEAMQHNLVLSPYTHSLEQEQLQIELKPYLPYVLTHTRTATQPPLVQSCKSTPHTVNHPIPPPSKTSLFQSRYSQSNRHKQDFSITTSEIS